MFQRFFSKIPTGVSLRGMSVEVDMKSKMDGSMLEQTKRKGVKWFCHTVAFSLTWQAINARTQCTTLTAVESFRVVVDEIL